MLVNPETCKIFNLPNVGYMVDTVPQEIMQAVRQETDGIFESNFTNSAPKNQDLVGHIDKEFEMTRCNSILEPYVQEMTRVYQDVFKYSTIQRSELVSLWANYQEKYEFNPIHDHDADISFVIWVKIPYNKEDEQKQFTKTNERAVNGEFHFIYSDVFGNRGSLCPQEQEGGIALFSSKLQHMVYPFYTSDEYRVSVAGNLMFENSTYRK